MIAWGATDDLTKLIKKAGLKLKKHKDTCYMNGKELMAFSSQLLAVAMFWICRPE